ncbi:MAG: DNA repair protein RadA [Bacteroidaceae bacterium]|nr:DNA repair protein RadA [Bacteroidaceae bacterium]
MAKSKTVYVCDQCGQESPKWIGKCPSCGAWNSFKELHISAPSPILSIGGGSSSSLHAKPLNTIEITEKPRIDTCDNELNRVLGGGIVPGSLILLGGEPGIGKSTLILQTIMRLKKRTLYVSGEESEHQLKLRANRLAEGFGYNPSEDLLILCETSLEKICEEARAARPELMVIDSVQTIGTAEAESLPGSMSQVRACATQLLRLSKEWEIPIILIGHITKDGTLAGPKVLEHIVDTVLQFEGDRQYLYRVLRTLKNRFGSTAELGIYEMMGGGLRAVSNPSEMLLTKENEGLSGVAVASAIEGARPFLIETQALVSTAAYGTPQRSATGFDLRRLNMLLAVLEKRVGFKLAQKDVFLNIAGGLRVSDPAIDLSVMVSILSSNYDVGVLDATCMAGEVGLSGEVRPVTRIGQRISEAERLGFKRIFVPETSMKNVDHRHHHIEIIPVKKVEEALRQLFS